ncbi:unnamed protein product [marine sediment metagenome]|uniref:Uncharacterized protein n=1 Tax=marine sediment metagenome TaxID=412755 RepID=X0VL82_9ZZZZ
MILRVDTAKGPHGPREVTRVEFQSHKWHEEPVPHGCSEIGMLIALDEAGWRLCGVTTPTSQRDWHEFFFQKALT